MNSRYEWKIEYENEIEHARQARLLGNEGMARVCARRAAGIVIGEFLYRSGHTRVNRSAYDRMSVFLEIPNIDEEAREINRHFLLKVNHTGQLPVTIDLIKDALWLKEHLLEDH